MAEFKGDLDRHLQSCLERALQEVKRLAADELLSENEELLLELLLRHIPSEIVVAWDAASRSDIQETTLTQSFPDFSGEIRRREVPASRVVVTYPATGAQMLDLRAMTSVFAEPLLGQMTSDSVTLTITQQDASAQSIQAEITRARAQIERRIVYANADISAHRPVAEQRIRTALRERKNRILKDRELDAALEIPVRPSNVQRPPIPAARRQVSLGHRKTQAAFIPEPVLEQAVYEDVLQMVESWGKAIERTPARFADQGEEALRDALLANLNMYWQGAAGGELFNGEGKTDVLIRYEDRNAFIAECKIWSGGKAASEALDQLCRYLVWRDSKSALIMFVKRRDASAIIGKLAEVVEGHPRHRITKRRVSADTRGDYVFAVEDDQDRALNLAVIPVVLRTSGT